MENRKQERRTVPREESSMSDKLTRMVDMRLPLHWLLGGAVGVGWALVSMYFQLGQLVNQMTELQIVVKSGNNSVTAVAGELALQKFRLQNVEDASKRNADSIIALQKGGGK